MKPDQFPIIQIIWSQYSDNTDISLNLSKEISNPAAHLISLDSSGYYAILGVSEQATYPEVKRAYRRMARKYHPDRNNSSHAEIMIKKINAAF